MTTAKTEGATAQKQTSLKEKELQTAYEIHTLAQMVYNQITMTNRGAMPTSAWPPSPSWMPTMASGAPPILSVPSAWPW